ncbi:eIF2A-related protein [Acaryochloris sp. CCMEE 5410]|uniref:WD40 domain-containing protein n=1 Tax=Acaryochloris sp. CCMEE 5410 TaxID=310037 RepID=UPI0002484E63|nr:NB-ARC domain-containing protein [Acaryochloris sp. CCMEE 5410]KAI9130375.1 NACHT domain-containing protein [Acaryochloris sp. CCMEE 5410]
MIAVDALAVLEKTLPPGTLNQVKTLVFKQAWDGKGYAEIAEEAGYDTDYIKSVAAQLWKSISSELGEKVTKTNFRSLLIQRLDESDVSEDSLVQPPIAKESTPPPSGIANGKAPVVDWGEAPDVTKFYGRNEELAQISTCNLTEGCRLVAVLGMGGIGKTSLITKLAQQVQHRYDFVIWRSLRNAPTADEVLAELIPFLSEQQSDQCSTRQLVQCLRSSRCLIIFDNVESILQAGQVGYYRPGYEEYGNLLRVVGETAHQSCLLLTSREKPPEVAELEGLDLAVRSFSLRGSSEVATALLNAKGIEGRPAQQRQLSHHYGGSPLALKIIASSIQDLFEGNLEDFLAQETVAFNGIRRLLDQQFKRLSPLEKVILNWLAINREWTSIAELQRDIVPTVSMANLLESLEALTWRSLIEKNISHQGQSGQYTLQPVVMEYVTNDLVQQVYQDLTKDTDPRTLQAQGLSASQSYFHTHALLKTTVKDYIQDSQKRLILEPLAQLLRNTFFSAPMLAQWVQSVLNQLHTSPVTGYGPGNLINLCRQLKLDLTGYDFSQLPIWQANLRDMSLPRVNFKEADFQQTLFTQSLSGILNIAYSPKGDFLATIDATGSVRLWRVADGQLHLSFEDHTYWGWALAFSPDGQQLASGGEDDMVRVWDVTTGQCINSLELKCNVVWTVAFSPNGQTLAIGNSDTDILLWDLKENQLPEVLQGHTSDVRSLQFSPDGQQLVSASHDHTLKIWNLQTRQCQQTFDGHSEWVLSVAYSFDGQTLASGSADRTVRLWDVRTGQCRQTLSGHDLMVTAVTFSPDGQQLASASEDRTIRVWDVRGQHLKTLVGHLHWVWSVAFSPDGQMLASGGSDQTVRFWHVQTGRPLKTLAGYIDYSYALAWLADGRALITGSSNHTIRTWEQGYCRQTWKAHDNWVWSASCSPDGQVLASGSNAVKLWDVKTNDCIATLQENEGFVFCLAWSPKGRYFATGSSDHRVRVWKADTQRCLQLLEGHEGWVFQVAWSPNGQSLASCGVDGIAKVWNEKTGECLQTFHEDNWIWSVAWSPDHRFLAYSTADGNIKFWDTKTWKLLQTLTGHTAQVTRIDFSPSGRRLASGSYDRTIKIWDVETGHCQQTLTGHTQIITNLAFHPIETGDKCLLASASEDETLRIWNILSGECEHVLKPERPYEGMNVAGTTGLSSAQIKSLQSLGAVTS